jgi:hypothetical protein
MQYSIATFQEDLWFSNSKSTSLQLKTSQITFSDRQARSCAASRTMGIPFEALLPYGIMIGVRWLSAGSVAD